VAAIVGHVVDEGVGLVAVLGDFRDGVFGQRRYVLGLSGHAQPGADQVDVEAGPGRGSDDGGDREPDSDGADRGGGADVEPEPVADVGGGGVTEVGFGGGQGDLAVEVDVECAAGAKFAGHERGCAFDHPVPVELI
jgi:hypothetical protein